jgi:hypothetical protein
MSALTLLPPLGPVERGAIFSDDRTCRRVLSRSWEQPPFRYVAWLMLNPSNAGMVRDDPTALRVTQFSRGWGYGGWLGVNVIPYISSDPGAAWAWAVRAGSDRGIFEALAQNILDIESVAAHAALRIVAFGNEAALRAPAWLDDCLRAFATPSKRGEDAAIHCLGRTASGAPTHPLARGRHRVPDDRQPQLWRPI